MKYLLAFALFLSFNSFSQSWAKLDETLATETYLGITGWPRFGYSVAIDGDYAVVGSIGVDSHAGRAFVLYYDGISWVQVALLTSSDLDGNDYFGYDVAIEDDIVVVSAYKNENDSLPNVGTVYVYKKPALGWSSMTETARLASSDPTVNGGFGESIDISDSVIIVGCPYCDIGPMVYVGEVYLFKQAGASWVDATEDAILTGSDATPGDNFGFSVSIDQDLIVVGSPGNNGGISSYGQVYLFEKPSSGWISQFETSIIDPVDYNAAGKFGHSVAVDDSTIVVSSFDWNDTSSVYTVPSATFVFEKPIGGWNSPLPSARLTTTNNVNQSGHSVDIDNQTIIVGALSDWPGFGAAQRVHVYYRPIGGWVTTDQSYQIALSEPNNYNFASDVAISNNQIIIGAPNYDSVVIVGAAFLYEYCIPSYSTITESSCFNYTSPSGAIFNATGSYTDVILSNSGCDSIITINLTITEFDMSTYVLGDSVVSLQSNVNYQWIDCDNSNQSIPGATDQFFLSIDDSVNYAVILSDGICSDTTDCILFLNCYPSEASVYIEACESYTSPSGNYIWTTTGNYIDTIMNVQGCDSVMAIDLAIINLTNDVTVSQYTLSAVATATTYQWVDCLDNYSLIVGANSQSYTITVNGSYAVILNNGFCIDTSACFIFQDVNIHELNPTTFIVQPNPTRGLIYISEMSASNLNYQIIDLMGRIVLEGRLKSENMIDLGKLADGTYSICIEGKLNTRIVKQ